MRNMAMIYITKEKNILIKHLLFESGEQYEKK